MNDAINAVRTAKAEEAAAFVMTLNDRQILIGIHESERDHPDFKDGRHEVLDAIEQRLGELDVAHPNI